MSSGSCEEMVVMAVSLGEQVFVMLELDNLTPL